MSKYEPLQLYLKNLKQDTWKTSFIDVENILGFPLPKSAYSYPEWWANDKTHSQGKIWVNIRWLTSNINLNNRTITFSRDYNHKIR